MDSPGISGMELPAALVCLAAFVSPVCLIRRCAGFSPWLGLRSAVPVANLGLLYYLAFARWPLAERAVAR